MVLGDCSSSDKKSFWNFAKMVTGLGRGYRRSPLKDSIPYPVFFRAGPPGLRRVLDLRLLPDVIDGKLDVVRNAVRLDDRPAGSVFAAALIENG
jgi:hypothetical protein